MRFTLGCTALVLLASQQVHAQTAPSEMVIGAAEVDVRSGPSREYYATGKLFKGDRVQVVKEEKEQPGWIAIKPPTGSVSWINAKNVLRGQNSQIAAVIGQEAVPVRPGGLVTGKTPVEWTKVQPGTLVVIVGKEEVKDSGTWLPIQPVPREVRYLPAEAVQPSSGPGVLASQPNPAVPPAQLLAQADAAFAAGNVQQAIQLYDYVARLPASDYQQRVYAQNRVVSLKGVQPGNPQSYAANPQVPLNTAVFSPTPQAPSNASIAPQWSRWARLRRTSFDKEGQPMYVLEDTRGQVLLYVTTSPGFTLRDYVGKTVALYGTITYRSDEYMRTHYMTASHVATLPNQ